MDEIKEILKNKSDSSYYLVAKNYRNNNDLKNAIKYIKKVKNKDGLYYYTLALYLYYSFKEKKALATLDKTNNLDLNNKLVNEIKALREAINSSLNPKKDVGLQLYSEDYLKLVENHIEKHFGKYDNVMHEIMSFDIHVDIFVINPTKERNFYTLVTCGMGAYEMNVPLEITEYNLKRAELVIYLPATWQVNNSEEKWYWPLRWLKSLARLPLENNTWIGCFHTIPAGNSFSEDTELNGIILTDPQMVSSESFECKLDDDNLVNFYQVFPLYENEMNHKLEYGAESLFSLMPNVSPVIDLKRMNAFDIYFSNIIDSGYTHLDKITEKKFDIDELCALNHIAIYIRWCYENGLTNNNFNKYFKEIYDNKEDIRAYIKKCYISDFTYYILNENGVSFADKFYIFEDNNAYPAYVDKNALEYFGEDKYNCKEFDDEAYLFVPYDEVYYNNMKKVLDKNYKKFNK